MREGDAIAAARRRLPMVEVDAAITLTGARGTVTLLDVFEGRQQLIAYYFMWHTGHPAPEQCEGCTLHTSQVRDLSFIHPRDATYTTFCQGPYEESTRYRDFMGWQIPWYYRLLDLTVYGRQEPWEDSPTGWPQRPKGEHPYRNGGRPIVQWPRLKAGYSDDLETGKRSP